MSNSDSSDIEVMPTKHPTGLLQEEDTGGGSIAFVDDSFNLFNLDYNALHKQAMQEAYREMVEIEELENIKITDSENHRKTVNLTELEDTEDLLIKSAINGTSASNVSLGGDDTDDCILLDIEDSGPNKRKRRSVTKRKRGNDKTTKKATKKKDKMKMELEALSKQISKNNEAYDKHNHNDVKMLNDDDEDDEINQEIRLRIKWGVDILRIPIRQLQPFSEVYDALGEQYGVPASRILLSHNHSHILPTLCPRDLSITLVDFIEGGILAEEDMAEVSSSGNGGRTKVAEVSQNVSAPPNSILLKVQNSDRNGSVMLHLGRQDKMKILMLRYAELQKLKLEDLKFIFDGEVLNPGDTPDSLDLDGDECIDVHQR